MRRTGGIIATILTSIFLGIPGLILGLMGMIAVFVPSTQSPTDQKIGSLVLLIGGLVLILIPIIVGATSLRKKKNPVPVAPIPQAPVNPTFTNPSPAFAQVQTPSPAEKSVATPPMAPPLPLETIAKPATAKTPAPGIPAIGLDHSQEIRTRLLALNRPTAPWQIIDGRSEGVDLIAEWKIVEAQWKEIFSKAKLTRTFRIYMKFDSAKKEVRTMDKETTVQWQAGFPSLHAEASTFKGQQTSISFGTGYSFTETLASGQVYKYRFNSNELKKPIQDAVKEAGWNYKGVTFGKL
jgi:hypothetical protein